MIFDLVRDFADILGAIPAAHPRRRILALLGEAIRRDVHFIDRHPTTLFQCLWNTCWWYDCPEAAAHYDVSASAGSPPFPWDYAGLKLYELVESWRQSKASAVPRLIWVRSLRPPATMLKMGQQAVLGGSSSDIEGIAYSPCGHRIVSFCYNDTSTWDASSGALLVAAPNPFRHARPRLSPDGKWLACFDHPTPYLNRCILRIWDVETQTQLHSFCGPESKQVEFLEATALVIAPDCSRIAGGFSDGMIYLWDTQSGEMTRHVGIMDSQSRPIALSAGGNLLLAGSRNAGAEVWDLVRNVRLCQLRDWLGCSENTKVATFSPDNRLVVTVALGGTPRLWDSTNGKLLKTLADHGRDVVFLAFSPDGRLILSGAKGGSLRVFDTETGAEVRRFTGHEGDVLCAAFAPQADRLVSGGTDHKLRVWDLTSQAELVQLRNHDGDIWNVALCRDPARVATCSADGTVRLWDATNGLQTGSLDTGNEHAGRLTLSSDGQLLISHAFSGPTQLWDLQTGLERRTLLNASDRAEKADFSPDERYVIAICRDVVHLFHGSTGEPFASMGSFPDEHISNAILSNDAKVLAITSVWTDPQLAKVKHWGALRGTTRLWDVATEKVLTCFENRAKHVEYLGFSPDAKLLMTASRDGDISVWDARTGSDRPIVDRMLQFVRGRRRLTLHHAGDLKNATFSRDGRHLISTVYVQKLKSNQQNIWDSRTGVCLATYDPEQGLPPLAAEIIGASDFGMIRNSELEIHDGLSGRVLGWFPATPREILRQPDGTTWLGTAGNHLYVLRLE